jgi:mannobiose 2-epimerase
MTPTDHDTAWAARLRAELTHNVLPWWRTHIFDEQGRVRGGCADDGTPLDLPRSAVLGTRLMWTFASAQHRLGAEAGCAQAAQRALDWVRGPLSDASEGGVFWSVDAAGRPLADHKQTYAQAFAIYGLAAFHQWRCAEDGLPVQAVTPALSHALQLFDLLEAHAFDRAEGGFFEGCTRDWVVLPGARLSDREPPAPKTTNTLLHVLEATTELMRCAPRPLVATRLRELVEIFLDRLWQPAQRGYGLFFARDWRSLTPQVSPGHDIEAAWLLVRAAEVLGDAGLLRRVRERSLEVADGVLAQGLNDDGSVVGERLQDGRVTDARRQWWCGAEAMVGLHDAWQIGGRLDHARAARRAWDHIERHHVDRVHGDWIKALDADNHPLPGTPKAGPWECPYHHVRACLEMTQRLAAPMP